MYSLSVLFEIDPAHREEFKATALGLAKQSLAEEKGCLVFEVYESADRPEQFYFHEVYASEADLTQVHVSTVYYKHYRNTIDSWVKSKDLRSWAPAK